jgi:hypothetical protein
MSNGVSGWEKASVLATILQTVVVVASLWYIADQEKQQTLFARASNTKSLADTSIQLTYQVAQDEKLAKLWLTSMQDYEAKGDAVFKDETEKFQFRNFVVAQMIFYENIYYQNKQGLLDPEVFCEWQRDLDEFIDSYRPYLKKKYWTPATGPLYYEEFRKHVDSEINNPQAPRQPC